MGQNMTQKLEELIAQQGELLAQQAAQLVEQEEERKELVGRIYQWEQAYKKLQKEFEELKRKLVPG